MMADIVCRWRNGTPKTVVELVQILPHESMSTVSFRSIVEKRSPGFFRTAYQLACQLGLYYESDEGVYYPRFDRNVSLEEADAYLRHWIVRYYVPNPYVRRDGFSQIQCPTYFLKSLCDYVQEHPGCSYKDAYQASFGDYAENNDDIVRNYINNYSEVMTFSKDGILSLNEFKLKERFSFMERNDKKAFFESLGTEDSSSTPPANFKPEQIIYYGVPGSGKSHKVQNRLDEKKIPESHTRRVVFSPDYCSADFLGQILPFESDSCDKVTYKFQPGPFTEILKLAYDDPSNEYVLVIEEINRGNAAAIFSEVFQLLDRLKTAKDNVPAGWSEYCIHNDIMQAYLGLSEGVGIRLPSNLSLLATMNTSDQNVFTLDNAFQRRWNMQLISNKLDVNKLEEGKQYNASIEGLDVCWGVFRDAVNKIIVSSGTNFGSSSLEDKRLGGWFVETDENNQISKETFAYKVVKYLWDDALKMDRSILFRNGLDRTLEDVIDEFLDEKISDKSVIFVDNYIAK